MKNNISSTHRFIMEKKYRQEILRKSEELQIKMMHVLFFKIDFVKGLSICHFDLVLLLVVSRVALLTNCICVLQEKIY